MSTAVLVYSTTVHTAPAFGNTLLFGLERSVWNVATYIFGRNTTQPAASCKTESALSVSVSPLTAAETAAEELDHSTEKIYFCSFGFVWITHAATG